MFERELKGIRMDQVVHHEPVPCGLLEQMDAGQRRQVALSLHGRLIHEGCGRLVADRTSWMQPQHAEGRGHVRRQRVVRVRQDGPHRERVVDGEDVERLTPGELVRQRVQRCVRQEACAFRCDAQGERKASRALCDDIGCAGLGVDARPDHRPEEFMRFVRGHRVQSDADCTLAHHGTGQAVSARDQRHRRRRAWQQRADLFVIGGVVQYDQRARALEERPVQRGSSGEVAGDLRRYDAERAQKAPEDERRVLGRVGGVASQVGEQHAVRELVGERVCPGHREGGLADTGRTVECDHTLVCSQSSFSFREELVTRYESSHRHGQLSRSHPVASRPRPRFGHRQFDELTLGVKRGIDRNGDLRAGHAPIVLQVAEIPPADVRRLAEFRQGLSPLGAKSKQ